MPLNYQRHLEARDRCITQLDKYGIRYVVKPSAGWFILLDLSEVSVSYHHTKLTQVV